MTLAVCGLAVHSLEAAAVEKAGPAARLGVGVSPNPPKRPTVVTTRHPLKIKHPRGDRLVSTLADVGLASPKGATQDALMAYPEAEYRPPRAANRQSFVRHGDPQGRQ
jgi:hypothetical protein